MATAGNRLRLLHVFSTFAVGGPQVRFLTLAEHFGDRATHAILAMDGRHDCAAFLSPRVAHEIVGLGRPAPSLWARRRAYRRILTDRRPDVLVTYNWGTIEWALANLPPICRHVHFEDGFGPEEAETRLWRRSLFRRLVLAPASAVVVPSLKLAAIASREWGLGGGRLRYIANGVDSERFAPREATAFRAGLGVAADASVLATVTALRPEKNVARMLRALAILGQTHDARLLIAGDGPMRQPLRELATELGIAEAVTFLGHRGDTEGILAAADAFVLSSDTEQMPLSVLEAMACARPIASVDVGDVKNMVSAENRPFIVDKDAHALAEALSRLLAAPATAKAVGEANRRKILLEYTRERMLAAYDALFFGDGARADA